MINKNIMHKYINKYLFMLLAAGLLPNILLAADGSEKNSFNPTLIWLLSLIIILLFVIGMMGTTLVQLGYAYREKLRKERAEKKSGGIVKTIALLVGFSLLSATGYAQEAEVATQTVKVIGGMVATEFYMLIGVIILELLSILALIILTRILIKAITAAPEAEVAAPKKKKVSFWDRFHNAVAIEKEEDIMLDHDYDGIKELDNSLPPWWKYGFYFTIVVAFIYMWYYHIGGNGPSSHEEYVREMKRAEEEVAAYLAMSANNVDENSVTMLSGLDLTVGKEMFETTCAACHNRDGGGNAVGPNLTDQYWLHGGSLKHIFKSIKYGWPDKGMKSWKDDFSPKQLAQLASYVKSLQGTTPEAPKAPQGELYIEAETEEGAADSTATEETPAAEE